MKVLVLGASGMLGSAFVKSSSIKNDINYYFSVRSKKKQRYLIKEYNLHEKKVLILDIIDKNLDKKLLFIKKKNFDFVINCIGIIKPHIDESNSASIKNAIFINSMFPHLLNFHFNNIKILQIATDCVYSGKKGFYSEESFHDAEDVYGKSKSLGEVVDKNFFNIRCSIIGEEINSKLSLIEWFKSQKYKTNINGFNNHLWNGLTTNAFCKLIESIILNKINIPNRFHLLPSDYLSKYELLSILKQKYSRQDLKLKKINHKESIDRTLSTNNKKIVDKIWKKSFFNKKLKIQEMIDVSL